MTKKEIKKAKDRIFAEYSKEVYMITDYTNGETRKREEKMQDIATINLFDYIK